MTIRKQTISVSGIPVEVVRKDIKNLHLGVYPPTGRVRVSAPLRLGDEAIRLAIVSRLRWIRTKQDNFRRQNRQSAREYITGESHYFRGRRYRLSVVEHSGASSGVQIANNSTIELRTPCGSNVRRRQATLERWYRQHLYEVLPAIVGRWEPVVGVKVREWRVKRMKTRWGTCNSSAQRIWVNLELIKKPPRSLEYVVVHELVHLLERSHNDNFRRLMDAAMPTWRLHRDELNRAPLAHEDWSY